MAFDYVDFDVSMRSSEYAHMLKQSNNQLIYRFFKSTYEKKRRAVRTGEYRQHIPTILHHVWFGERLSDEFKQLRQTWIDAHPNWTFILWTDDACNDVDATTIRSFQELGVLLAEGDAKRIVVITDTLAFDNHIHFDAAYNYDERSDILKW